MKCLKCDREMIYDGCDYYHCDKCGAVAHDLVYRDIGKVRDFGFGTIQTEQTQPQFWKQGWVCPKCGGVMSPTQPYCLFCQLQSKDIQVTTTGITPTISTENKSISEVVKNETT